LDAVVLLLKGGRNGTPFPSFIDKTLGNKWENAFYFLYLFGLNNRYHAWYKEKKRRWGKRKQGSVEIFLVMLQWEEA
jgi:hypothetical protein